MKPNRNTNWNMLKKHVNALDMQHFSDQNYTSDHNPIHLLSHGFHECLGIERADFATVFGFVISASAMRLKQSDGKVLLCSLTRETQEYGELYACGLETHGLPAESLLCVDVKKEQELYWVAEECLSSNALSAIIIIGSEHEKLYNFTVSRRLKLRSENTSAPLYFVRHCKQSGATAAHARWRISRRRSSIENLSTPGKTLIGNARFSLHLEKPVSSGSQSWEFEYDTTRGLCLAQSLADRPSGTTGKISRAA